MRRLLITLLFLAGIAFGQGGNTVILRFAGAPTGSCSVVAVAVNNATGDFYDCLAGSWNAVSSAGGGGTVTSVSFTGGLVSVANPTTTPALTVAGTSGGIPYFSGATTWASSAALAAGGVVLGGGAGTTPATNTGLTFSSPTLTVGLAGTSSGILALSGSTSGTATFTAPATAGTRTNAVASSNVISVPDGSLTASAFQFASEPQLGFSRVASGIWNFSNGSGTAILRLGQFSGLWEFSSGSSGLIWNSASSGFGGSFDTGLYRQAAGVLEVSTSTSPNASGSLLATNLTASGALSGATYLTASNCANAASPAVCGSAASGAVAVPTGTNPTLTINTTAVTANSRIFLQNDEGATIAATTCNTTLSSLVQPVVTARVAGTSFTIQIGAVIATNPACVSYLVFN